MIISHRHKFAYFRNPKTGSTTTSFMLRMCGAFNEQDVMAPVNVGKFAGHNVGWDLRDFREKGDLYLRAMHMTPAECVEAGYITKDQLREYNCYAFVRNPYDRITSGLFHVCGAHAGKEQIVGIVNKIIDGAEFERAKSVDLVTLPQHHYFFIDGEQVVEPLDFRKYEAETRKMIEVVGGIDFPVFPRMNARPSDPQRDEDRLHYVKPEDVWTDEMRSRCREARKIEFDIYEKLAA